MKKKQIPFKAGDRIHVNPIPVKYCYPTQLNKELGGIIIRVDNRGGEFWYEILVTKNPRMENGHSAYKEAWFEHECLSLLENPENRAIEVIEMAAGFCRAFIGENPNSGFSDLFDDICDSYSVIVDSQHSLWTLENILRILKG